MARTLHDATYLPLIARTRRCVLGASALNAAAEIARSHVEGAGPRHWEPAQSIGSGEVRSVQVHRNNGAVESAGSGGDELQDATAAAATRRRSAEGEDGGGIVKRGDEN